MTTEGARAPVDTVRDSTADKERSGIRRRKHLSRMCCLASFILAMSVVAVVVGSVTLPQGGDFSYVMSSVGAAGVMSILSILLTFCYVRMAKKVPLTERFPFRVLCMARCVNVSLGFTWVFIFIGLGMGGIFGVIVCHQKLEGKRSFSTFCDGDANMLLALAAGSLAVVCVLMITLFVLQRMYFSENLGYVWQGRYLVYESDEDDVIHQPAVQMEMGLQGYCNHCHGQRPGENSSCYADHRNDHRHPHDPNSRDNGPPYDDHRRDQRRPRGERSMDHGHTYDDRRKDERRPDDHHSKDHRPPYDDHRRDHRYRDQHHARDHGAPYNDHQRDHRRPRGDQSRDLGSHYGDHRRDERWPHGDHSTDHTPPNTALLHEPSAPPIEQDLPPSYNEAVQTQL